MKRAGQDFMINSICSCFQKNNSLCCLITLTKLHTLTLLSIVKTICVELWLFSYWEIRASVSNLFKNSTIFFNKLTLSKVYFCSNRIIGINHTPFLESLILMAKFPSPPVKP
uniref:Uncharacterized protein n=1 Tax=Morchella importuna TaxID=1174673 RepID=A0A650AFH6_9PEZI|nr:hypothetical protein [Morchella importuna]QGN66747.1 hypothetical protein [Morchella importuna]